MNTTHYKSMDCDWRRFGWYGFRKT